MHNLDGTVLIEAWVLDLALKELSISSQANHQDIPAYLHTGVSAIGCLQYACNYENVVSMLADKNVIGCCFQFLVRFEGWLPGSKPHAKVLMSMLQDCLYLVQILVSQKRFLIGEKIDLVKYAPLLLRLSSSFRTDVVAVDDESNRVTSESLPVDVSDCGETGSGRGHWRSWLSFGATRSDPPRPDLEDVVSSSSTTIQYRVSLSSILDFRSASLLCLRALLRTKREEVLKSLLKLDWSRILLTSCKAAVMLAPSSLASSLAEYCSLVMDILVPIVSVAGGKASIDHLQLAVVSQLMGACRHYKPVVEKGLLLITRLSGCSSGSCIDILSDPGSDLRWLRAFPKLRSVPKKSQVFDEKNMALWVKCIICISKREKCVPALCLYGIPKSLVDYIKYQLRVLGSPAVFVDEVLGRRGALLSGSLEILEATAMWCPGYASFILRNEKAIFDSLEKGKGGLAMRSRARRVCHLVGPPWIRWQGKANVLCIDGGGTRGVVALRMLEALERMLGKPIMKAFDFVIGTSTGALIATGMTIEGLGVSDMITSYHAISKKIFQTSFLLRQSLQVFTYAKHSTSDFECEIKRFAKAGELLSLSSPKIALVSTRVDKLPPQPFLLRSYGVPEPFSLLCRSAIDADASNLASYSHLQGSSVIEDWKAVRASTAAPSYFDPVLLENIPRSSNQWKCDKFVTLVDGALSANCPSVLSLSEFKNAYPGAEVGVMVSIGTGCYPSIMNGSCSTSGKWSLQPLISTVLLSATECEDTSALAHSIMGDRYVRLNVEDPLFSTIELDEARPSILEDMEKVVENFLKSPAMQKKLKHATSLLLAGSSLEKKAVVTTSCIAEDAKVISLAVYRAAHTLKESLLVGDVFGGYLAVCPVFFLSVEAKQALYSMVDSLGLKPEEKVSFGEKWIFLGLASDSPVSACCQELRILVEAYLHNVPLEILWRRKSKRQSDVHVSLTSREKRGCRSSRKKGSNASPKRPPTVLGSLEVLKEMRPNIIVQSHLGSQYGACQDQFIKHSCN
mmetsp:Transcript_7584/g.19618  ORF Transcript_7584/g.19618 Transcript_7584/m.19618 type:complete len:1020 (-) Transcript_7584:72-3131(-)